MDKTVRAAEPDVGAMVNSFCDAFADDPGLAWIWPDRADRLTRLPHFFTPIVGGTVLNGVAFRSKDSEAVSLWRMPAQTTPTVEEIMPWRVEMAKAFSEGSERSQLMSAALKAYQPTGFHWWYLQFIGVRPEAQGTGLGGEVIRAGLEIAAGEDTPVYVEVMNPDNLGYYRHIGFETVAEFDIPDSGPHVWAMQWRKA